MELLDLVIELERYIAINKIPSNTPISEVIEKMNDEAFER